MANPWEDEFKDGDEDDLAPSGDKHLESRKEWILCLVDVRACMYGINDPGKEGKPMLECVFRALAHVLKDKAISESGTRVGVLLVGAGDAVEYKGFRSLHMLLPLDLPSAAGIRTLLRVADDASSLSAITGAPISAAQASTDLPLGNALWAASSTFSESGAKLIDDKSIWIFTNDDNPATDESAALQRAKDCWSNAEGIRLWPFQSHGRPAFDAARFWDKFLAEDSEDARTTTTDTAAVVPLGAGEQRVSSGTEDAGSKRLQRVRGEKVHVSDGTFDDLADRIIQRSTKKRVYSRLIFTLADGIHLGVGIYNNLYPAKKPSATFRRAADNSAVKSESRYLDTTIGAPLEEAGMVKYADFGGSRVMFTDAESRDVKIIPGEGRGLRLLGFKPIASIRLIDNIRPPVFVYPLEGDVEGSTTVFRALWDRMLSRRVAALARYEPRDNAAPRIVALIPAPERLSDGDSGAAEQISPPGMYAVILPYADDIRNVHVDQSDPSAAERDEIAAAEAVVDSLSMPSAFTALEPGVSNPAMQKFYLTLEALALGEKSSGWDDAVHDTSRPQKEEQIEIAGPALEAFVEKLGTARSAAAPKAAAIRKRAPAATAGTKRARAAAADAEGTDDASGIDWEAEHRAGRLDKHTMDELKMYLRAHGLPLSGKKADLVERVKDALSKASGAAPENAAGAADEEPEPARARAAPAEKRPARSAASRKQRYVVDDDDEDDE